MRAYFIEILLMGSSLLFAQGPPSDSATIVRETKNVSSCNVCPEGVDARNERAGLTQTKIAAFEPNNGSFSIVRETTTHGLAQTVVAGHAVQMKESLQSDRDKLVITRETSRTKKVLAPVTIDLVEAKVNGTTAPRKPSTKVHKVDVNVTAEVNAKAVNVTATASDGLSIVGQNQQLEKNVSWNLEALDESMRSKALTLEETGPGEHRLYISATIVTVDGKEATKVDSFLVASRPIATQKPESTLVRGVGGQLIEEIPAKTKQQ